MTKEQEEAIERCNKLIETEHSNWIGITNQKAIETVLNMLKENSAEIHQKNTELAEKNAEIEKKDKKDKIIDLMAERIEWLCKSNGILLDKEHDENFTQEDIKKYFERKTSE